MSEENKVVEAPKVESQSQSYQKPIHMKLEYDPQIDAFRMIYFNGESHLLSITILPQDFEKLANDMVKIVKDYNLAQAEQYQKKVNDEQAKESSAVESESSSVVSQDNKN
jgi:hypothetical protein